MTDNDDAPIDDDTVEAISSDAKASKKQRKCLRCSKMFNSSSAGNRVCPKCKGQKAPDEGGIPESELSLPKTPT